MSAACPDCGAQKRLPAFVAPGPSVVRHNPGCPVSLGVDRALDEDRKWFAARPRATRLVRPVTPAEASEVESSLGWRPSGNVTVVQFRPGVRSRYFTEQVTS